MVEEEIQLRISDDVVKNDSGKTVEDSELSNTIYYKIEEKLKDPKTYFIVGLTIFILFALIGLAYAEFQIHNEPAQYTKNIDTISRQVTHKIKWNSEFSVMIGIFKNNLTVGFILFTITLISSSLVSFLFYMFNGGVLGYVLGRKLSLHSLMLILPHGIIEIPAIVYFGWIGTRFNLIDELIIKRKSISEMKSSLVPMLKHLTFASLLLLVSAFVEAFVTGKIAGLFS